VLERAGAGKGQFYRYFDSKDDLVPEVMARQVDDWVNRHAAQLGDLSSLVGIRAWCDTLVANAAGRHLTRWCPIAGLAGELVQPDRRHQRQLGADAFRRMASYLTTGLAAMQHKGELEASVDPARLAMMFIACFEGGLLVAVATGDVAPLRDSLDAALSLLAAHQS
jgi:AcrR family transcriptional regulator